MSITRLEDAQMFAKITKLREQYCDNRRVMKALQGIVPPGLTLVLTKGTEVLKVDIHPDFSLESVMDMLKENEKLIIDETSSRLFGDDE